MSTFTYCQSKTDETLKATSELLLIIKEQRLSLLPSLLSSSWFEVDMDGKVLVLFGTYLHDLF